MKTYVLYHKNCMDGFAAAWAAWKSLGDENIEYIAVQYGEPLPLIDIGSRVFILDFSYSKDYLLILKGICPDLIVIDHHKTAQANCEGLNFCIFDMTKSGAVLTWEYFHPDKPVPELLFYIQDRDLWQWRLPYSKQINTALATVSKTFLDFNILFHWGDIKDALLMKGVILLEQQDAVVKSMADKCFFDETMFNSHIPMLNSATLQSEIGNELCLRHKGYLFSAIFFYLDLTTRVWSLRSVGDFDVSEVAKKFGGGGHKNAAGFKETILVNNEKNNA